jgi:hypothetical protein
MHRITRSHTVDGRTYWEDLVVNGAPVVGAHDDIDIKADDSSATSVVQALPFALDKGILSFMPPGELVRHVASSRHLLVVLEGSFELECAGGIRRFGVGDIVMADDLSGEGHIIRALEAVRCLLLWGSGVDDLLDGASWAEAL